MLLAQYDFDLFGGQLHCIKKYGACVLIDFSRTSKEKDRPKGDLDYVVRGVKKLARRLNVRRPDAVELKMYALISKDREAMRVFYPLNYVEVEAPKLFGETVIESTKYGIYLVAVQEIGRVVSSIGVKK